MALSEAEAEAAASVTAAMFDAPAEPAVEAPESPVSSTPEATPATPELPEETVTENPFDFNPEIPDEILREIDEADIDAEVEAELATREPVTDEYNEYEPQESEEDARSRLKLEKRNKWLEDQLAQTKRGQWEAEAKKYFPLSEHALGDIKATSRRAFLKEAKARHELVLPHVQKVLAEAKAHVDEARTSAKAEGRAAAKAAFGVPMAGPDVALIDQAAANEELAAARADARKTGSLTTVFKKMFEQGL
jgi:hypothetical protein